jgi:RNA polymerase sigma-70 factor (ECF subfamily)
METDTGGFPSTHWSLISRAGQERDETQHRALGELLKRYAPALRKYLISRRGLDWAEADDVLQEFLAAKVVERNLVGRADPERGRFRTFLLTALDNFTSNYLRDRRRQKRGGDAGSIAVELAEVEATSPGPEAAVEAIWAREVLSQAMQRMRDHCLSNGRDDLWYIFQARMLTPLDGSQPVSYEKLVADLQLDNNAAGVNLLTTAKRAFERALRAVIGEYEFDPSEIEGELRDLRAALARGG